MLANVIVAASNLYAYFVIRVLFLSECYWGACIFFCSMSSSCLFHLVETKEISHHLPKLFGSHATRISLGGTFGEHLYFGELLLRADRIFAVASIIYLCYFLLFCCRNFPISTVQLKWAGLFLQAVGGMGCLLYSDVIAQDHTLFTITHCLWHICAYDTAYKICCTHSTLSKQMLSMRK